MLNKILLCLACVASLAACDQAETKPQASQPAQKTMSFGKGFGDPVKPATKAPAKSKILSFKQEVKGEEKK